MDMQQMMFVLQYHSPKEELLTASMKDMILLIRLAGTFKSVAAFSDSFTVLLMHDAIDFLAKLGYVKVKCHGKTRSAKTVLEKKKKKEEEEGP